MPKNRISKRKDGRYGYAVTSINGRRLSISSWAGESLKDFRLRCDALDKKAKGTSIDLTFSDLFDRWMSEHVSVNLSASELRVTAPVYERHVRPYLGHRRLSDIRRQDVYTLLADAAKIGLSASYVRKIRSCISRPYNWGINTLGLELTAPTQGLVFRMPEDVEDEGSRSRVIREGDLARFFKAAEQSKYYAYFKVLALTGIRPSEALGLRARDIKGDTLEIRRGVTMDGLSTLKTKAARRDIPLTNELKEILTAQRNRYAFTSKEGWLFPTVDGEPNMVAIRSAFERIKKQTATWERGGRNNQKKLRMLEGTVDFTLYDFRHTFATRMAEAGMHQTALQMIMGHSDISITLKYYIGVTDTMLEDARKIMSQNIDDKIDDKNKISNTKSRKEKAL